MANAVPNIKQISHCEQSKGNNRSLVLVFNIQEIEPPPHDMFDEVFFGK